MLRQRSSPDRAGTHRGSGRGRFFNGEQSAQPGYQKVEVEAILDSPASGADLAHLKYIVDRHCPVLNILSNPTPVQLSLRSGSLNAAAE